MEMNNSIYLKGPSFYKETDQDIFWGREKETEDVYYLVSNSDFGICYAKSGEGKSSLINAGLIPLLRKKGFLPICIRFTSSNYKEEDPNFDNIIGKALEDAIKKVENGSVYKSMNIDSPQEKKPLCETLWWKLRVNEIRKDAFTQLTPVLIFDQFEEIFTCSENIEWVSRFFAWLEGLYNDMNPLDDANIGRLPKKFKVLLSLRSEYVCELDYWSMQRYFIPSLKNNRYYLKALTEDNAVEIADNILDKANIDNISKDDVLRFSQNEDTDRSYKDKPCKSALKLSLILDTCYRYKEQVVGLIGNKGKHIDGVSLSDILEIYYSEATNVLSKSQCDRVEDLLVDSRGRRNKVLESELCSIIDDEQLEKLKEKRIVTTTGSHEVEIAHDCLREIVFKHSSERRKKIEQERNQAVKNKWYVILLVVLSGCAFASFLLFRKYGYQEIIDSYRVTKNLRIAFVYGILKKGTIFILPYLLPLLGGIACCHWKKKIKKYIEVPEMMEVSEIISVTFGTLFVLSSCFFYDSIFSTTIGTPNINDSCWGVFVTPCLLFACCISYIWKSMKINGRLLIAYPISIVPLIVCEFINEYVYEFVILIFVFFVLCASIGILAVVFKKCPTKERVSYVTINSLVLIVCFFGHLGFCPFEINCSEVDTTLSIPWHCTVIKKNQQYGIVDSWTGDTIVPCLFDGIADGGLVMLMSPTGEELKDSLLSVMNIDSIVNTLKDRGYYTDKLKGKNGIRYVYTSLDKALFDIIKKDSAEYDVEASKAYFAVRDGLYKAIKKNLPINKIDTTNLAKLYEMECDSVDSLYSKCMSVALYSNLKKKQSDFNTTELLITHSARKMSVAALLDMINDKRSKLSMLVALDAFRTAFFSQKLYEQHINYEANINFNFDGSLRFNAVYSNKDLSPLSSISLWQYLYVQTLSLTAPLYASNLPEKLSEIKKVREKQLHLSMQMLKNTDFDSDDVDCFIKNYKKSKDLMKTINAIVSKKSASQSSYVDSLITINDKYKIFDPFRMFAGIDLSKIRQTATKNISQFYDLYKCYSLNNSNDYQYAIFRKNMVDNLYIASFCGGYILSQIKNLKEQDSLFFNNTYKELGDNANTVELIRKEAGKARENYLNRIKGILQERVRNHK